MIVDLDGIRLEVRDEGHGEPALVFLHYWGGSSRTWAPVIARLASRHRCIAPDLRGWGSSDKRVGDFSLEAMAGDVVALIDRLALSSFVLVGHSMGGKVAQIVAARQHPGLVGLVLVAPAPLSPLPVPAVQRAAMLDSYRSEAGVAQAIGVLAGRPLSADQRRHVLADTLSGAEGAKRAWTEAGMVADFTVLAGRIVVPALVIVGEEDRVEPVARVRAEVADVLGAARLVTVPGVGHLLPIEAPDELAAASLAFLAGLEAATSPGARGDV